MPHINPVCPKCRIEMVLWLVHTDPESGRITCTYECPGCFARVTQ